MRVSSVVVFLFFFLPWETAQLIKWNSEDLSLLPITLGVIIYLPHWILRCCSVNSVNAYDAKDNNAVVL